MIEEEFYKIRTQNQKVVVKLRKSFPCLKVYILKEDLLKLKILPVEAKVVVAVMKILAITAVDQMYPLNQDRVFLNGK